MDENYLKYILIALGILALFIKIPKIELPIWKWILTGIGKSINEPVMSEIKNLKELSDKTDMEIKSDMLRYHEDTSKKIDDIVSEIASINSKVDGVSSELKDHIEHAKFTKADETRQRIIDFSDLIVTQKKFSKEAWRKALKDCDDYISFCNANKNYPNTEAEASIENVKTSYMRALENNDFLY